VDNQERWLLKIFGHIIDIELKEIPFLDVDLSADPEKMKDRLQFWRALNEYNASLLAYELDLNVPVCYLITSQKISDFEVEKNSIIPLDEDEIVLDEDFGAPETADEFYYLTGREKYFLETSENFETLLRNYSLSKDETTVIGVLTRMVPNVKTLQGYFDVEEFTTVVEKVSSLDDAYSLIPFDVWLNDPDRNQGNYLIQFDKDNNPVSLVGIDYEMWSFGSDIWQDVDIITQGRSYLTAVVHKSTNFFDDRILETFFKISTLSDIDIEYLTFAPVIMCKFIEYHINQKNLNSDERFKLLQIEENNRDFLFETVPKIDKLSLRLIRQIGLPSANKELEEKILNIKEEEFYFNLESYLEDDNEDINDDDESFEDEDDDNTDSS
jgi:hypothetical protein